MKNTKKHLAVAALLGGGTPMGRLGSFILNHTTYGGQSLLFGTSVTVFLVFGFRDLWQSWRQCEGPQGPLGPFILNHTPCWGKLFSLGFL